MTASTTPPTKVKTTNEGNTLPKEKPKSIWEGRAVFWLTVGAASIGLIITGYEFVKYIAEVAHDKIWKPDIQALEKKIQDKFEAGFCNRLQAIKEGIDYIRVCKHLPLCSKDEEAFLKQLQKDFHFTDQQLVEILKGAHVRLKDGGKTYDRWCQEMTSKYKRTSSHSATSTQYGVSGDFVKQLLFSKVEEKGESYTWFQLENHPVKFGHYIRHMLDFVKYKLSMQNQGPYGSSMAIDTKPILLEPITH